jgi:hypothetical protein
MPGDPAFQLYERLVDALGTGPVHTADESAALARIVAWRARRIALRSRGLCVRRAGDAFELGRLNAQAEAEGGTE